MYVHEGVAEFGGAVPGRISAAGRPDGLCCMHAGGAPRRRAGCDLAMALTSPGSASQRNIERVGFQLANQGHADTR